MMKVRFNDLPNKVLDTDEAIDCAKVTYGPTTIYPQPADTAFEELLNCKLSNDVDAGWVLNFTDEAYTMFLLKWGLST